MSSALLRTPAEVIQQLLIDLGAGSDPDTEPLADWPVYADEEPDGDGTPDEVLTVYDSGTDVDDGHGHADGFAYTHYGVQVRVRARDHTTGSVKALEVRRLLNESVVRATVTVEGTAYTVPCVKASPVRRMGREQAKTRRHLWTVNGIAVVERQPAPTPGDPHTILTATDNGVGAVLFTTAGPHGLSGGEQVMVVGNSVPSYNGGPFSVDGVPTPTSWETGSTPYTADGFGGTWS